jgi:hypothetical protein
MPAGILNHIASRDGGGNCDCQRCCRGAAGQKIGSVRQIHCTHEQSGTWWRVYFSFLGPDLAHERAESPGTFTPGCNLASNAESPAALNSTTRWPKSTVLDTGC